MSQILVVGGSVSTGAFVTQLRSGGYTDEVVVVDPDPDAPYDRPPLSKEFLSSDAARPEAPWWDDSCEIVRGRATSLNRDDRAVSVNLDEGGTRTLRADDIVIATGSAPVRLPGLPSEIATLRTAADGRRIRDCIGPGRHVTILGAGTIGTELASAVVGAGGAATLIDLADRPLDRFLAGHLAAETTAWIKDAEVELQLESRVEDLVRTDDRWLVSTTTSQHTTDLVVSAVGARPVTNWLDDSGVDARDGVRCDHNGTALDLEGSPIPHLHAMGDASAWLTEIGSFRRREDWTSAQRQGRHLASHLLGLSPTQPADRERERDYFWSHQFGRRIQVLGRPERDATLVQHVDAPARNAAFYTVERDSEVIAWISVNSPREFAVAMRDSMRVTR
jgi:3-phenylpropionate/trans-cinnamate dioxygenase ferredoxin reductase subunit